MTTTHVPHVTGLTRHLSMCQEFPEDHIECLMPGSCEGTHAPEEVIVKSGSFQEGVYMVLEGTARMWSTSWLTTRS